MMTAKLIYMCPIMLDIDFPLYLYFLFESTQSRRLINLLVLYLQFKIC